MISNIDRRLQVIYKNNSFSHRKFNEPLTLQLPGVENCQNYTFRYGRHPLMELPLMINPTGCARSEPKILTHCKR